MEKSVAAPSDVTQVKSIGELEKILKELQPGKPVTINFGGKEIVLDAKGN